MIRSSFVGCLFVLLTVVFATSSFASAPYDISVTVNGSPVSYVACSGSTTSETCINVEGTYGNVRIERIVSTSAARVEIVTADSSTDTLRLINARIKSLSGAQAPTIVFKRQFKQSPGGNNVYYKIIANGTFTSETGNAFVAKGWYTNPTSGTADQMGVDLTFTVVCDDYGCSQSADKKSGEFYNPGSTDRLLQADFTLTLIGTNSSFSTGTGVKLSAPDQPEGGDVCPECKPKAELGFFCLMTYTTAKISNCPSCVLDAEPKSQTAKLNNFIKISADNILEDMAMGHGEHLASAATLLNIPQSHQPAFFSKAQDQYATLIQYTRVSPEHVLSALEEAWRLTQLERG